MKSFLLNFFQTIVGRNMNYNAAKQIIQSESYLNAADSSIIRRKGNPIEFLEDSNVDNDVDLNGDVDGIVDANINGDVDPVVDANVDDIRTILRTENFDFDILEEVEDRRKIRRKRNLFDILEERNVYDHANKGDIAYEAIGLFTEEKVDRYCMTQHNRGMEAMWKKIDRDAKSICDLYWY